MRVSISASTLDETCNNSNEKMKGWLKNVSLKFSFLVFLIVNVVLLVTSIILLTSPLFHEKNNICLSEECVKTASRVLRAMDRTVDPCTDFYEYACGGWMNSNPVPDWTFTWDRLTFLANSMSIKMRQLLEKSDHSTFGNNTEPKSVQKARMYYRACMNTEVLEIKGLQPLQNLLKTVGLQRFPPENQDNDHFDWLFTIARTRRLLGGNMLIGLSVTADVRNSSVNKIIIEQVSPGFSERYLLQAEKFSTEIKNYKKYITQMLRAYTNFTGAEDFAQDIVNFSTEIAKIMTPSEVRRSSNHQFHEVNLVQLAKGPGVDNESWSYINWTRYINTVFNDTSVVLEPKNDTAIVLDLRYLQKLVILLKNTNKLIIERFLWWNVFSSIASATLDKFRSLEFEFSRQMLGHQSKPPRWKKCTYIVNDNFGLALSYLYVKSHFNKDYRDKVLEMLEDIRKAFEEAVHELDWMDDSTRERTLIKLHAIRAFVGYPGWIMNATELDNHYKNANVFDGNFFQTNLNLTNTLVKRSLEKLRKETMRYRWIALPTAANAFYSAPLNSVTFPAAILEPPFYGNGIEAIDYGAIGSIMGHEVTHGFDDQGRRYDEHGNLKQWWSASTLEHYHGKVQCIVDQYNNYTMPGLGQAFHVQGYITQGENIADNGGLRTAYEAYKYREAISNSMHRRLPGLSNITTDQLFFLAFAQTWCGNSTTGALKNRLTTGHHSPNRIRVIGTLSNSKDFAKAWNCPEETPMNPKSKCVLW